MPNQQDAIGFWSAVGHAFRAVWTHLKTLVRRFLPEDEYAKILLSNEFQDEESQHLQRVADKFSKRGQRLRRNAFLQLAAALSITTAGIAVFLVPTQFTDFGQSEAKLDEVISSLEESDVTDAILVSNQQLTREVATYFATLVELHDELQTHINAINRGERSTLDTTRRRDRLALVNSLLKRTSDPKDANISLRLTYTPSFEATRMISAKAISEAASRMNDAGIDAGRIMESIKDVEENIGSADATETASKTVNLLSRFRRIFDSSLDELAALDQESDSKRRTQIDSTNEELAANRQVTDSLVEMIKLVAESRSPWINLLTIRIGIVVLLLFLTSILLATYRYTLTLSAFYLARSDALQLVSARGEEGLLDIKELEKLIPLLTPDSYRIDSAQAPYSAIAGGKG